MVTIKLIYILSGILLAFGMGVYYFYRIFTGPMYVPKDLTSKKIYQNLLIKVNKEDRENYFELNGNISLYYEKQGNGKTPVLIIHGGPGMPFDKKWDGLDKLNEEYTFYYYHQRGTGKSIRPFDTFESSNFFKNSKILNKTLGIAAHVADIEQIRKKNRL